MVFFQHYLLRPTQLLKLWHKISAYFADILKIKSKKKYIIFLVNLAKYLKRLPKCSQNANFGLVGALKVFFFFLSLNFIAFGASTHLLIPRQLRRPIYNQTSQLWTCLLFDQVITKWHATEDWWMVWNRTQNDRAVMCYFAI